MRKSEFKAVGKFWKRRACFAKWRKANTNGVGPKRKFSCCQLILATFMLFISTKAIAVDWWNLSYSYRRQINITNGAASPLEQGYSVAVVLDTTNGSKFQPDGDDLRVVYWNGSSNVELDREVININSITTNVWFRTKVAISVGATDNNYYLYYGNAGASNPPANLNNVYIFGDDFESGLGRWSYYNGQVSTSSDVAVRGNKSLKIANTRNMTHDQIYINMSFPFTTLKLDYYVRLLQINGSMSHNFHQGNTLPTPDQSYGHSSTISWSHLDNANKMEYNDGNWHTFYNGLSANHWYHLEEYFDFNSRKMMINVDGGNFEVNDNTGLIYQPTQEVKYFRFWAYDAEPGTYYIDDVKVRKYIDPEPTTSLQAEESGTRNQLPIADAGGPYSGLEGGFVVMDGSASFDPDTDGVIVSYEWDVDGDGAYDDTTGAVISYTWNDDYSGTVGLRVTDNNGGQAVDKATVVIGNVAPVAEAGGPYTGTIGSPLTLNGSATDPGSGDTLSYAWDLDNDSFYDDSTQQNPSYTWNTSGDKTVWLKVTDDNGGVGTDSAPVTISPPTRTPIRIVLDSPQPAYAEVEISIKVGDASETIADLFAIAFRFNYPIDRISEVISVDASGDLLGGDVISHVNIDETNGEIRMSLSRKRNQGGVSGFGKVAIIKLRISAGASGQIITFSLDRLLAVNPSDNSLNVYSLPTQLVVTDFVVWPGDTNNDRTVNELDILPLGSFWLRTGPPRASASSTWEAQKATPWSPEPAATCADANGDGTVNEKEVITIGLNWERSHNGVSPAPARSRADQVAAYKAMYLFLEDAPATEPVERIRAFLLSLIDQARGAEIPVKTSLSQNYPNPINPETWIPFDLSKGGRVTIRIYNLAGEYIRTLDLGELAPGTYHSKNQAAHWDGLDNNGQEVASGVYLYQLVTGDEVRSKRMIVLR